MRSGWLAALVLPLALLGGCGDDGVSEKPDLPDEPPALWNPCDVLDPDLIRRHLTTATTEESGTETAPECRFRPEKGSGDAVVTASYTLFSGTLDDAWDTMGQPANAEVTDPSIAGADAARIVVDVVKKQLYVTGFVQNGELIQSLNVVDPAPYDQKRTVTGVRSLLAVLSEHARAAGVGGSQTPTDGAS